MKHLELYESYGDRKVTLESVQKKTITFDVVLGNIKNIVNNSGIRFPFYEGARYSRNIETWCCNNNFTMDGKDMCESKIFGVRTSDVPKGHEWRTLFPKKFRS